MHVEDLKKLFANLPDFFIESVEGKELTTCWYGSPYLDIFPMDFLDRSHPSAVTKESVDVFFYSDIDFIPLPEGFYTDYHQGKIRFPKVEKWSGEVDELYPLFDREGQIISYKLRLRNDGVVPSLIDEQVVNQYSRKTVFRNKLIEFHQICDDLYRQREKDDISEWGDQEYLDNLRLDLELGEAYMGPKLEASSLEIIRSFLDLKYRYAKESEVDFSVYEFNACLVEHKRADGSPFFTFYIDIDDSSFEKILLNKGLKIDFAAYKSSYVVGPGPRLLANLGCRYVLGSFWTVNPLMNHGDGSISLPEDQSVVDFDLERIATVRYRDRDEIFAAVNPR